MSKHKQPLTHLHRGVRAVESRLAGRAVQKAAAVAPLAAPPGSRTTVAAAAAAAGALLRQVRRRGEQGGGPVRLGVGGCVRAELVENVLQRALHLLLRALGLAALRLRRQRTAAWRGT